MTRINYIIKYNNTNKQLNKIFKSYHNINVIYNIRYNHKDRKELNIIKSLCDIPFLNNLFTKLYLKGPRIVNVEYATQNYKYFSFLPNFVFQFDNSKIIIEIPIKDQKKYIVIISEQTYTNLEKLYFISYYDGSKFYAVYHSKTFDYLNYENVKKTDSLLGFYKPQKVKLPSSLCWSCKYFNNELTFVRCAVNPSTKNNYCFECRDYEELKSPQNITNNYFINDNLEEERLLFNIDDNDLFDANFNFI